MIRLFRLAFWFAAGFAFAMAIAPHPPELPVSDKIQHMTAFAVLTLLGCIAYPNWPRIRLIAGLIGFGGLIEIVQMVPALHRDSQWSDWFADIAAVLVALVIATITHRVRITRSD